jgi:hypothetical protein
MYDYPTAFRTPFDEIARLCLKNCPFQVQSIADQKLRESSLRVHRDEGTRPAKRTKQVGPASVEEKAGSFNRKKCIKRTGETRRGAIQSSAATVIDSLVTSIEPSQAHFRQFLLIEPYSTGI